MASILLLALQPVVLCPCSTHVLRVLRVEQVQCVGDVLRGFSPQNTSQHALEPAWQEHRVSAARVAPHAAKHGEGSAYGAKRALAISCRLQATPSAPRLPARACRGREGKRRVER